MSEKRDEFLKTLKGENFGKPEWKDLPDRGDVFLAAVTESTRLKKEKIEEEERNS